MVGIWGVLALSFSAFSSVKPLRCFDPEGDQKRHQNDAEHDFCDDLTNEQVHDREEAVKGEGDEDQGVDRLA